MRFPKLHKKHEQFLAPTPSKLLLAAVLFVFITIISPLIYGYLILNAHMQGLPMPFLFRGLYCISEATLGLSTSCPTSFFWHYFVVDLVFWYLVACLFVHWGKLINKG